MFFRLLWRLVRKNIGLHYVWPLVIAVILESAIAWTTSQLPGHKWPGFYEYWLDSSHLVGLLSIYLTFLFVIATYIKKASDVRSMLVQSLDDILPAATRYFAIGTIPLKEWFDPDSLTYLATIVGYQRSGNLKHERVLLFYSDYDLQALQASYLDELHARCFNAIHKRLDINLGFLKPKYIMEILSKEEFRDHKRAFGCYRRFTRMIPERWQMRKRPSLLPFAVIEMKSGEKKVVKFDKGQKFLRLEEIVDEGQRTA
jgi:hypothetical protein